MTPHLKNKILFGKQSFSCLNYCMDGLGHPLCTLGEEDVHKEEAKFILHLKSE